MATPTGHVSFIWSIAELLRGDFKQSEYGRVVLPFTLLRRLDQVLAPTREKVIAEAAKYEGRGLNLDPILKKASGHAFYNASNKTLELAHSDADNVATHLQEYISGFDADVREIFEAFEFEVTLGRLQKAGLLYKVLGKFLDEELNLHPDAVSPAVMGDIFEELIRRFSEMSNETAGEHFTPREVVRLCAELVLVGDEELASTPGVIRTVYDPACGTGGMLSVTEELVRERNPDARLVLFGQELNPESWAVCRAEMLLKGQDPSRIASGSTLSADGHPDRSFDYMLANPPFGVDWTKDHGPVVKEHEEQGHAGRFGAGLPRRNDGSLLFLQNMLAKMKPPTRDGGSRIAIIFNGSPLFSGTAGSGESEIRRWILENDWLEAIVALPEQLFYNTGISTYIWVLTDHKASERQGKVQLINARDLWEPMRRSLGDKRRKLSSNHISEVLGIWRRFESDGERSKVRSTDFFGYRRIVVERPLRLRYRFGDDAAEALKEQPGFQKLAEPSKSSADPDSARAEGERAQLALLDALRSLNSPDTTDAGEAKAVVKPVIEAVPKLPAAAKKAVWDAISVRDPSAPLVLKSGTPEPDAEFRDVEHVPLQETVDSYMEREVLPFDAEAWVDESKTRVGYEIPLGQLFYKIVPTRSLDEIDADLQQVDEQVQEQLREVLG